MKKETLNKSGIENYSSKTLAPLNIHRGEVSTAEIGNNFQSKSNQGSNKMSRKMRSKTNIVKALEIMEKSKDIKQILFNLNMNSMQILNILFSDRFNRICLISLLF